MKIRRYYIDKIPDHIRSYKYREKKDQINSFRKSRKTPRIYAVKNFEPPSLILDDLNENKPSDNAKLNENNEIL